MDVKATIVQLTEQRDRINIALAVLEAIESPPEKAPEATLQKPSAKPQLRRKKRQTTAELLNGETVLALLTPTGVPSSTVQAATKGSDNQILRILKRLEADGKVRRSGERRSTRWHTAEIWVDRRNPTSSTEKR